MPSSSVSNKFVEVQPERDEKIRIKIPDITNPRFSYSGGKILSELVGLNYALEKRIKNVVIIRPHNVYGNDMGNEHVIPELINKALLSKKSTKIPFLPFVIIS